MTRRVNTLLALALALASPMFSQEISCRLGGTGHPYCFPDSSVCTVGCVLGANICETTTCSNTIGFTCVGTGTTTDCVPGSLSSCGNLTYCMRCVGCPQLVTDQDALAHAVPGPFTAVRVEHLADGTDLEKIYYVYPDGNFVRRNRLTTETEPETIIVVDEKALQRHLVDALTRSVISGPRWPAEAKTWRVLQEAQRIGRDATANAAEAHNTEQFRLIKGAPPEATAMDISAYTERSPGEMWKIWYSIKGEVIPDCVKKSITKADEGYYFDQAEAAKKK